MKREWEIKQLARKDKLKLIEKILKTYLTKIVKYDIF